MAERALKTKSETRIESEGSLSAEAGQFLAEAKEEYDLKQKALDRDWSFGSKKQWGYDQRTGLLRLEFMDGTEFHADGQILGSYSAPGGSWEWAWNNPYVEASIAEGSQAARKLGERLGLSYLTSGTVPVPSEKFLSCLCAIGVKATASIGVFRGTAGPLEMVILLKKPRWPKKSA